MSHCCAPGGNTPGHPGKLPCPANGQVCAEVSARTITHHLKSPWTWQATATRYFFCDDPACDIVYFGDDGSTIGKAQLRSLVGAKEDADDSLLCYCFGVSRADYQETAETRDFVVAQTKAGLCSCETSNPSGRCCLKDFPKAGG